LPANEQIGIAMRMEGTISNDASSHGVFRWQGQAENGAAWEILRGDVVQRLGELQSERFQVCVTSPPYFWQRDYGVVGQLGLEATVQAYVDSIIASMREVRRCLNKRGTLFLNLGDTYYSAKGKPKGDDSKNKARRFGLRAVDASGLGFPRKTALGIPWRIALGMIDDGWILRSPIIWRRNSALPEPTSRDRPWRTHETIFLFARSPRYDFSRDALGADEDIWTIEPRPRSSRGIHSAAFPEGLAERCILCGSKEGEEILDPFGGTGTTIAAAVGLGRNGLMIDLSPEYCEFSAKRLADL